ncbi:hypothetical protein, partial [Legionella impletisoli]|uniref:hypothetical protein n=1 Tax=Legionella impletisoli TaxID=343510 RepID=UPI001E28AD65
YTPTCFGLTKASTLMLERYFEPGYLGQAEVCRGLGKIVRFNLIHPNVLWLDQIIHSDARALLRTWIPRTSRGT